MPPPRPISRLHELPPAALAVARGVDQRRMSAGPNSVRPLARRPSMVMAAVMAAGDMAAAARASSGPISMPRPAFHPSRLRLL